MLHNSAFHLGLYCLQRCTYFFLFITASDFSHFYLWSFTLEPELFQKWFILSLCQGQFTKMERCRSKQLALTWPVFSDALVVQRDRNCYFRTRRIKNILYKLFSFIVVTFCLSNISCVQLESDEYDHSLQTSTQCTVRKNYRNIQIQAHIWK